MLNHRKFDVAAFRNAIACAVLGLGSLNFAPLAVAQTTSITDLDSASNGGGVSIGGTYSVSASGLSPNAEHWLLPMYCNSAANATGTPIQLIGRVTSPTTCRPFIPTGVSFSTTTGSTRASSWQHTLVSMGNSNATGDLTFAYTVPSSVASYIEPTDVDSRDTVAFTHAGSYFAYVVVPQNNGMSGNAIGSGSGVVISGAGDRPPVVGAAPPPLYMHINSTAIITPTISDPDGDALTYSIVREALASLGSATIDSTTGVVTVTSNAFEVATVESTALIVRGRARGKSVQQALHIGVWDPVGGTNPRVTVLYWNASAASVDRGLAKFSTGTDTPDQYRVGPDRGYLEVAFSTGDTTVFYPYLRSTPHTPLPLPFPPTMFGANNLEDATLVSTSHDHVFRSSETFEVQYAYATAGGLAYGDALAAGRYYFAVQPRVFNGQGPVYAPDAAALGGRDNPIVFPGTPTELRLSGNTLSWTQAEHTYTGFTLYHHPDPAMVDASSGTDIELGANGVTCAASGAARRCSYSVTNLNLTDPQVFFKLAARGSTDPASGNPLRSKLPDTATRYSTSRAPLTGDYFIGAGSSRPLPTSAEVVAGVEISFTFDSTDPSARASATNAESCVNHSDIGAVVTLGSPVTEPHTYTWRPTTAQIRAAPYRLCFVPAFGVLVDLAAIDISVVAPEAAPTMPAPPTIRVAADGVRVSWTKPARARSFELHRGTSADFSDSNPLALSLVDAGCAGDASSCAYNLAFSALTTTAATRNYFRVLAVNSGGKSPLSAGVVWIAPATLTAPTGLRASFTAGRSSGSWQAPVANGGLAPRYELDADDLPDWLAADTATTPPSLRVKNGARVPNQPGELAQTITYTISDDGGRDDVVSAEIRVMILAAFGTAELAKTALPDIVLAMADSTASGIKSRIGEVRRGCATATEFSLDGAQDFASIVTSQAEYEIHGNRNWRKMLGNSKFAVSHDNGSADRGFCGVWGQGNFQNLDGEHSGVKWDGSLSGFSLGADTRLGSGKLLGIAVNNQSGAFDITKDATTSQYDVALSSVSPYLGWQSANGTDFHASLSVDSGEGEIKTRGNVTKHDLSGFGVGFGFRSSGALKGDLVYSSVTAEESVTDGADISESVGVGRLRLAWERSRQRVLASGASLNLNGEIGGRADTGTAGGGLGAELGFGFGYAKNSLKFGGNLRTLLFHSGDVGEFGAQIRISIQPEQDGQGLSLNIAPTYGQTASSLANLWENGISKITAVNPDSYKMRINAQLGYGFSLATAGLVTPYATANYGNSSQFGLGLNWKPKLRDLELDLLGEQSDSQQRVLLKGTLGF